VSDGRLRPGEGALAQPWLGVESFEGAPAHKFTRANDFRDLSALSRNFFRRKPRFEVARAGQPGARFVVRRTKPKALGKLKGPFRHAKRNLSHGRA
jgi:hypothetical protein